MLTRIHPHPHPRPHMLIHKKHAVNATNQNPSTGATRNSANTHAHTHTNTHTHTHTMHDP
jgi:hypothetical protein